MGPKLRLRCAATCGVAGIALSVGTTAALAQNTPATAADDQKASLKLEEIVVTGTQIRGIEPVGSNVVGVSEQEIKATGAITMNQLLSQLPQSADFNEITQPGGGVLTANSRVPITRPNIRNLPGAGGSASGAVTLVLINGHRVVPQGIEQTAVDPDIIAPGIVERVETILDGASGVYGSDAVGGVINFITRKSFDGVQGDIRYGVADDYDTFDANLTGGTDWGTGSFFGTYSYGKGDALYGRDRDYVRSINWTTGVPTGRQCDAANATVGAVIYAMPTLTPGLNSCEAADDTTITPSVERNNAYVVLNQSVSDSVTLGVDALYSRRENVSNSGPFRGSVVMGGPTNPSNPYYRQIAGTAANAAQTVQFSYGPVLGNFTATNETVLEAAQVTPSITIDLSESWQLRGLVGYGRSETSTSNIQLNTTLQTTLSRGTTLTTAINPYDIAATQNRALFDGLFFNNKTSGEFEFLNPRLIADGKVFSLSGGDVRGAFGIEYAKTDLDVTRTDAATRLILPTVSASQDVISAFAELLVPIVSAENSRSGIQRLDLSLSARYDEYSDFGDEVSPKIGVTYDPVEWFTLRGNWGKSFNAPTVSDKLGINSTLIRRISPVIQVPAGTQPVAGGQQTAQLVLTGTIPELVPQSATNWAVGFDLRPGTEWTVSATYYHIDFKDIISLPQTTASAQQAFDTFPELFPFLPANATPQQIAAFQALIPPFVAQAPSSGPAALQAAIDANQLIVNLFDNRTRNLGGTVASGIDLQVAYQRPTSFGSFDVRLNGNYQLERDTTIRVGGPTVDDLLYGIPDLRAALTVGADFGALRAQATLNHTAGYDLLPTTANLCPCQSEIDQFDVVNLFFRYGFQGTGLLEDLALTLNVNNVSDAEPPVYKLNGGDGYANGRTVGRLFQFGISKTF